MLKETRLYKDINKLQIDNIYVESGKDWLKNLQHKPNLIREIRERIEAEQSSGVDIKTICKKWIWH